MGIEVDSYWSAGEPARIRRTAAASRSAGCTRSWKNVAFALLVAASGVSTGCGSEPSSKTAGTTTGPLLPFQIGNTWTYRVTNAGVETLKTTTIEAESVVGGTGYHQGDLALHVVTRKGQDEKDKTESWQVALPDAPETVVRYREVSYGAMTGLPQLDESWDQYKPHIPGDKVALGVPWLEEYKELKIDLQTTPATRTESDQYDYWTVVGEDVKVTAGDTTYPHAVHLSKVAGAGSGDIKHYWYVRGIGKVREEGGQTEELISHELRDAP